MIRMVLIIIFLLLLLSIVYVLFTPIILWVDTYKKQYFIQLKGIAKASLEPMKEEVFRLKLNVLFFNYYLYPLKYKFQNNKNKKTERVIKNRSIEFKKIVRVLNSFKIKKMLVNIDTGDWTLNAKLYPLFYFSNYGKGNFRINFQGRNQLVLHIQNRPIDIIKSYINFKT